MFSDLWQLPTATSSDSSPIKRLEECRVRYTNKFKCQIPHLQAPSSHAPFPMIRENYIEIKTFIQPHSLETINTLANFLTVPPGRVAVLCDPHVDKHGEILVAPGKYRGSQNSDSGTVVASGVRAIKVGDRVGFLPMHGLRCSSPDFNWVPAGLEIRFYGVACPYDESLIILED